MTTTKAAALFCQCSPAPSWTNAGDGDNHWWVCSTCGKRSEHAWKTEDEETGVINYLRGGPSDGNAYTTDALLLPTALAIPGIQQYEWTSEMITSQTTGAVARVWVYDYHAGAPQAPPTAAEPEPVAASTDVTGELCLTRRKALKLTRAQLSELSDVKYSQLTRIETGNGEVKDGMLARVDAALSAVEAERHPS